MNDTSGADPYFRPFGASYRFATSAHGLRRGLHSFRRFAAWANLAE